jgi:hypothetical protein
MGSKLFVVTIGSVSVWIVAPIALLYGRAATRALTTDEEKRDEPANSPLADASREGNTGK